MTLKKLQHKIETLQAEYRHIHSLNTGVIVGAIDTTALRSQIRLLMHQYNCRARRTKYYGGQIVPRGQQ